MTSLTILVPLIVLGILGSGCSHGGAQRVATRDFEFVSGDKKLSGIIDYPTSGKANGIVIFVHGSGNTNIREDKRYFDLRSQFVEIGLSCVMWDKPGQGRSEGVFCENQPIEASANEVTDAISWLKNEKTPGIENIGLWATSRGCWVAPLVISQNHEIKFWIAIGGVPAEDNKYYLMKSNLPLEGHTQFETEQLMNEWRNGRQIFFNGGDYSSYLAATANLRKDPAVAYLAGDLSTTKEEYYTEQKAYMKVMEQFEYDKETFSIIRVRDFDKILKGLNINVLAMFGEKDTNVDWIRARELYKSTIGRNPQASLTIRTFPTGNHSINVTKDGSVRELEGTPAGGGKKCAGYYETQIDWLLKHVISE